MVKNGSLIIECVGLPGAGKTTCCSYLSDILEQKDIKVCTVRDLKLYIKKCNILEKSFLVVKTLTFKGSSLFTFCFYLLANKVYSLSSMYRYLRLLIFYTALIELSQKRIIEVFLFDQWIIQELWSATIFKLEYYDRLPAQIIRFDFNVDFTLYFDISILLASERIDTRKSNLSRFDRMTSSKRIIQLEKYSTYLYKLFENSKCSNKFFLSSVVPPETNAQLVYDYIAPILNKAKLKMSA